MLEQLLSNNINRSIKNGRPSIQGDRFFCIMLIMLQLPGQCRCSKDGCI